MSEKREIVICTNVACMQDWGSPQEMMDTMGPVIDALHAVSAKQKRCLRGCATKEKGPFIDVVKGPESNRISLADLSPIEITNKVRLILGDNQE
jgi:hypothetical protein